MRSKVLRLLAVAVATLGLMSMASASSEDLVIDGLAGTLLRATQPSSPHLVVIVAGSGPSNRDGNHANGGTAPGMQTNMYKQLAEALAAEGVASFRYDKRGVGGSRALVANRDAAARLMIGDFADDLVKVVAALKARPEGKSIVIAGHSEGSMLAMMAASKVGVSGLALLSGGGLPFIDIIERQLARQPLPEPLTTQVKDIIAAYRNNQPVTTWPPELVSLFNPINDTFMRSVASLDPRDLLRPITVPVLIAGGAKDIQVVRADFDRLASVRPTASEVLWVDDMAHTMKVVRATDTSPMDAYAKDRSLSEAFVAGLVAWLKALPAR